MMRLVTAIIGIGLAGAMFFFYTQPSYDSAQVMKAQIVEYNAALDKANELQALRQTLLARRNAFTQADLDRLQKLLPDHVDNVRLILDLDNLAGHYGLSLQNVDVTNAPSSSSQNQAAVGDIGSSDQRYDSLTLTFGTHATYPTFVKLLQELESSLRVVDLVSLSIDPDSSSTASGSQYNYKVVLRTYWLK